MACRYRWLLVVCLAAACARRPAVRPAIALGTSDDIQQLVRLALTLDAAADRAADTLYAGDAIVIRNARVRLAAPRFAGVSYGGRVTVAAATVTVEGRFAWAMVDYRWVSGDQQRAEAGRATFICERRAPERPGEEGGSGSSWRIVHAHSSQLLPWER
ncbi:MAG: hypothetical protein ACREMN_06615 [Gemmatimonadales bacterium]